MDLKEEIRLRIKQLNQWTKLYDEGNPEVSDKEWDDAYFKLADLERANNIYFPDSPTQSINFQVVNQLKKVTHNHPMLSLAKTKDINDIVNNFINDHDYIAMCKMDGLTCSLRYVKGKLVSAETRGDGMVGEDILHNILTLPSVPKKIPYENELIIDGEIICKTNDFKSFAGEYKNPRNFASGSIRLLDAKECSKRKLTFVAWDVIKGFEEKSICDYLHYCLNELDQLGFETVPYTGYWSSWEEDVKVIQQMANSFCYPIDGVVFKFDSRSYGKELGRTEHHFKNAMAYKFYDETYLTKVIKLEWTMGKTGVLTPIAVLEPIEIDGTVIERASVHNVSVLKKLGLRYQFQKVEIFKANQIIPQIAKVYDYEQDVASVSGMEIPDICPYCGGKTEVVETETSTILKCTNPQCNGKLINRLDHYCGKKGMDIKGLSKATLGKLIDWGWLNNILDLYSLSKHQKEWVAKPGFGVKSVANILEAIEKSKDCELWQFLSALGIPLIGSSYAKEIARHRINYYSIREDIKNHFDFTNWDGFGVEMRNSLLQFDYKEADILGLQKCLNIKNSLWKQENHSSEIVSLSLKDINVVITGKLIQYKNRDALKEDIERHGGKVTGSISKKTNYLINNDSFSSSAKNKAAIANNIPVLTEEEFIKKFFDK